MQNFRIRTLFKILSLIWFITAFHPTNAASYKTWQPLKPGDTVYIIGSGFDHSFKTFSPKDYAFPELYKAREVLGRYGLKAVWDMDAFQEIDPLCPERAMTIETSFKDLIKAFKDPNVKAIWALEGGRLTHELWEHLDQYKEELPKKPILGFSDVTCLHLWFNAKGYASIHSPVLKYGTETNPKVNKITSYKSIIDILMGRTPTITYNGLKPMNPSAQTLTTPIKAPLTGGNLSSLLYYDNIYGALPPCILMIETVDEPTRIDSILSVLRISGFFKNTQAIIFGQLDEKSFEEREAKGLRKRLKKTIQRFAAAVDVLVFSTIYKTEISSFQFGHGDQNDPLPFGTMAELTVAADPAETTLTISAS